MNRKLAIGLGLAMLAALLVTVGSLFRGNDAQAQVVPPTLFIDANGATNGDCNVADTVANVGSGTHTVQICLTGNTSGTAVDGTDIKLLYDNTKNQGVELGGTGVTCDGTVGTGCVNDNPNLNEAALGTGWSCDAFGTAQPIADTSDLSIGDTSLQCFTLGSTTLQNGLIATVTFNVIGVGADLMTFSTSTGVSIGGGVVDCAPASVDLTCGQATINKGPTPTPTFTPTTAAATATFTPTRTFTPTTVPPTATFTPTRTFTPTTVPATATFTPTGVPATATFTPTGVPATATFTPTPVPPTATFTPTRTFTPTTVPPTATFTPTGVPPTATFTPTTAPATATFTPTTAPPTATFTPTRTFTPTTVPPTATFTPTVAPTTPTHTPVPGACVPPGQKVSTIVNVLIRFGSDEGENRYKARYDLDGDGDIDLTDLTMATALQACGKSD